MSRSAVPSTRSSGSPVAVRIGWCVAPLTAITCGSVISSMDSR
ncbi:hypothetical protein ACFQ0B_52885 [Nonomuraea thailandensis]